MFEVTQRLQLLRFKCNRISQRKLAFKLGMPQNRYWEIENGYRVPSADEKRKIARALNSTADAAFPKEPRQAVSA